MLRSEGGSWSGWRPVSETETVAKPEDVGVSVTLTPAAAGEWDAALVQCDYGSAEGMTSEASLSVLLPPGTVRRDAEKAEREAVREAARLLEVMARAVRGPRGENRPPARVLDV